MLVADLGFMLSALEATAEVSKNFGSVAFSNGKAQYLGRSVFMQIDNATTAQIPDGALALPNVSTLSEWLTYLDASSTVALSAKNKHYVVTCGDDTLSLAQSSNEGYADAVEIVNRPTIVDNYQFNIDQHEWTKAVKRLNTIDFFTEWRLINVSTTDENVVLGAATPYTKAKSVQSVTNATLNAGWSNFYDMDALSIVWPLVDTSDIIEISYSENTAKTLSPLTLRYPRGVILVCSPAWK